MSMCPFGRDDEQAGARRSAGGEFPAAAEYCASVDARPDADLMRVDAPQVSQVPRSGNLGEPETEREASRHREALDAYREFYDEYRTHTIRLLDHSGATMTVRCPRWCESDHAEDKAHGTFAADFAHRGAEEALHVDLGDGTAEDVLLCEITQYPFGKDMRTPTVVMWPTLGMTEGHLDADGLCVLAEQLQEYAGALIDMSLRLAGARKETAEAHRADFKGRWNR